MKIPENLVTLLINVIRVLMEKSGYDHNVIEKYLSYVEKQEGKEQISMFEAVIESLIEERIEAKEEGRIEERKLNARNAIAEGVPLETVQKITGLDMESIRKFASEL